MSWHERAARDERGFTMVELLVTVLVIGILIAIGLPTFLGARSRAQDRHTQEDLRVAFTAEQAYYSDTVTYTANGTLMTAIEPALAYVDSDTPVAIGSVYLHYHPATNEIFVSGLSASGMCFYLRSAGNGTVQYARSLAPCGIADTRTFGPAW
jgi:type IV pilus assembly protein PilA